MTSALYYPHAIDFNEGAAITQLTRVSPMYNFQDVTEFSSGDVAPFWSGSLSAAPGVDFASRQIESILELCDPTYHTMGKAYVAYDGTTGNATLWYRKGELYGLREDDATEPDIHERLQMTKAFLRWDSISATQGQLAEVACTLLAGYDGTNDPLIQTAQDLSHNEAVAGLYTLGPISVNGFALDGLQSYTWSNNNIPETVFDSGVPFPTYLGINTYSPTITARVRNASLMRTFGGTLPNVLQPRGIAITSFAAYLRKLKASDLTEADATAAHIKFSATAGTIKAQRADSQGMVDVFIQLQRPNASSLAFTVGRAVAIT